MRLFHRDEHGTMYLLWGDKSYVRHINEWRQFLRPDVFNWITFTPIRLDFDLSKVWYRHFDILFIIFGVGFRFHYSMPTEDQVREAGEFDRELESEMAEWDEFVAWKRSRK